MDGGDDQYKCKDCKEQWYGSHFVSFLWNANCRSKCRNQEKVHWLQILAKECLDNTSTKDFLESSCIMTPAKVQWLRRVFCLCHLHPSSDSNANGCRRHNFCLLTWSTVLSSAHGIPNRQAQKIENILLTSLRLCRQNDYKSFSSCC